RHEDAREDPAQHQLVDDVGGRVRRVVTVRHDRETERRERHRHPEQAGDPREQRATRHHGRAPDGGFPRVHRVRRDRRQLETFVRLNHHLREYSSASTPAAASVTSKAMWLTAVERTTIAWGSPISSPFGAMTSTRIGFCPAAFAITRKLTT